ncbi:Na+ driven multidrug efflux pump [Spironucleus salmonicida]|uniref:Na+ driven multidrug efflux pump n=1 Tax=Spironucleus salmonicida TaxID=348837 RepID=V6LWM8_9EUKA|nr:Na+ driven multidrug efflux pump [Spironucleus salmonicida]|eukprot:EST48985.1 Na+ driven multidrug efflux pump [Spironucleus salmonicida]
MFDSDEQFVKEATLLLRIGFAGMFLQGSITFSSGVFQMRRQIVAATLLQVFRLIINVIGIYVIPLYLDIKWIFIVPTTTEIRGFIMSQIIIWQQSHYFKKLADKQDVDSEEQEKNQDASISPCRSHLQTAQCVNNNNQE